MSKPWFRDAGNHETQHQLAGVIAQVLGTSPTRTESDIAVARGNVT